MRQRQDHEDLAEKERCTQSELKKSTQSPSLNERNSDFNCKYLGTSDSQYSPRPNFSKT